MLSRPNPASRRVTTRAPAGDMEDVAGHHPQLRPGGLRLG